MKQPDLFARKQLILPLVSSKGGVGKSTLAACLAVEAANEGEVYIVDLDPQQSTAAWWRRRKGPQNPLLVTGVDSISRAVRLIKERNAERDYIIVDTPGSFLGVISDAIAEADAVIAVVQPSGKDLEAQGVVDGLIAKTNKFGQTLYVLNRVDKRSKLTFDAAAKLTGKGTYPPFMIKDLDAYVRADMEGKTAPEVNNECKEEITALWQAIKGIAENGHRKPIRSVEPEPGQSGDKRAGRGKGPRADRRPDSQETRSGRAGRLQNHVV